ncbi:hypothetical protein GCM10027277_54800 [Pseudoduganella ginsengisoli]
MIFKLAMLITGLIMIFVACGNFLLSYAVSYGRVDRVTGDKKSLVLSRNGVNLVIGSKLQVYNDLDRENGNLARERHIIVFFCNWKPWSCVLGDFKVDGVKNL